MWVGIHAGLQVGAIGTRGSAPVTGTAITTAIERASNTASTMAGTTPGAPPTCVGTSCRLTTCPVTRWRQRRCNDGRASIGCAPSMRRRADPRSTAEEARWFPMSSSRREPPGSEIERSPSPVPKGCPRVFDGMQTEPLSRRWRPMSRDVPPRPDLSGTGAPLDLRRRATLQRRTTRVEFGKRPRPRRPKHALSPRAKAHRIALQPLGVREPKAKRERIPCASDPRRPAPDRPNLEINDGEPG